MNNNSSGVVRKQQTGELSGPGTGVSGGQFAAHTGSVGDVDVDLRGIPRQPWDEWIHESLRGAHVNGHPDPRVAHWNIPSHPPETVLSGPRSHMGGGVWARRSPFTQELFLDCQDHNPEWTRHLSDHGMPDGGLMGQPSDRDVAAFRERVDEQIRQHPVLGEDVDDPDAAVQQASEQELALAEDLLLLRRRLNDTPVPPIGDRILRRRVALTRARLEAGGRMLVHDPDAGEQPTGW